MTNFFSFIGTSRRHVGDDQLLAMVDGELSLTQSRRVQRHLECCWNCRARRDKLQGVIRDFVEYSNDVVAPYLPPPPTGRDRFLAALNVEYAKNATPWWSHSTRLFRAISEQIMNPVVITIVVVTIAGALLAVVWKGQNLNRHLTPDQFLKATLRSELTPQGQVGVAYQKVEIRSRRRLVERSIYRDLTNRRKPLEEKLNSPDASIKRRLESAGIDWLNPLSPSNYQVWHDHVHVLSDEVRQTAHGEWTLTTKTDDSTVRESSLTVRDADFRPIARQVVFRDSEKADIAELNYDVLPWSGVNMALFEPLPGGTSGLVAAVGRAPIYKAPPSMDQLVSAELRTDLALAKLRTNGTEDIRVETGESSVIVRGIVETDSRKREIEEELSRISLVRSDLQSFEQIERKLRASSSENSVQVHSTDLQPSPLELFMTKRNIDAVSIVALSRTLTESSLIISREAKTLSTFDLRYGVNPQAINEENRGLLLQLKEEHLSTLLQALANEESALAPYAVDSELRNQTSNDSLSELAEVNQQLSSELISGSGDSSRPGDTILLDLIRVSSQIKNTGEADLTSIKNLDSNSPWRP